MRGKSRGDRVRRPQGLHRLRIQPWPGGLAARGCRRSGSRARSASSAPGPLAVGLLHAQGRRRTGVPRGCSCHVASSTRSAGSPRRRARTRLRPRPGLGTARALRLQVLSIERFGLGEHLAALERLKQKLAAEGLFATERKRPLPRLPRRVGLVTGNDAAAKRDVVAPVLPGSPGAAVRRRDAAFRGRAAAEISQRSSRSPRSRPST